MKLPLLLLLLLPHLVFSQSNKFTLIGEYVIENNTKYKQTIVGGLSGIDYGSGTIFYVISDDPGKEGPPRFYKVNIDYTKTEGIKTLNFLAVTSLGAPLKKSFASTSGQNDTSKYIYGDAESIRYDKTTGRFMWSSEGYNKNSEVSQPFIVNMDTNGLFINKINTDPIFLFDASHKKGPEHNATFEALAYIPNTDQLVYCSEKSLVQDVNSLHDSIQAIRITVAHNTAGITLSQFAYPLKDVFNNNSNGIAEILAFSADSFLVLERAYDKREGNAVRLYLATVNKAATDVKSVAALRGSKYTFLKKELLLDLVKSGAKHVDNIEGMSWGYPLSENKKAILFVSDNNFNAKQVTQLLLFEYERK